MSNDILTQLQTCYDQLLTQFFSTVSYLSQRHPLVAPDPDPSNPLTYPPSTNTTENSNQDGASQNTAGIGIEDAERAPYPLRPVPSDVFANAQQELAEDLVSKGQQIQLLISRLPGIGRGEEQQAEEIKVLVEKVREMEKARRQKRKEMREYVRKLDDVIMGMATSMDYEEMNGNANSHMT